MNTKFDVCLMNPPYANGLGQKFFLKGLQIADVNVSVLPAAWLLGRRQNKKLTDYFDRYGGKIEQIFGIDYFDAEIIGTMSINYLDKRQNSKIIFGDNTYEESSKIRKWSNDPLMTEFYNKVRPDLFQDNVENHIRRRPNGGKGFIGCPEENAPDPEWWIIRLRCLMGHPGEPDEFVVISKSDFEYHCGKYKDLVKRTIYDNNTKRERIFVDYYIHFDTEREVRNFYNFIRTDFARACLWFYKAGMSLKDGILKSIPWFDFNEEWNDEKLFQMFEIKDEVRKHIEEILPDYYNIRK